MQQRKTQNLFKKKSKTHMNAAYEYRSTQQIHICVRENSFYFVHILLGKT